MLTWMRKWAVWIMLVALVGFLLTIFLEWGMGLDNMPGRKGTTIGKIGKEYVGIREFSLMLERERQSRAQQGQPRDDGSLPMQVWEAYVSETITNRAIRNLGLEATTKEVYDYLRDNPPPVFTQSEYFQTDGRFDRNKYLAFINTPSSYDIPAVQQIEEYIRTILVPFNKLNMLIESGIAPSFSEIELEYRARKETATFEFINIHPYSINLSQDDLSDERLREFYNANILNFRTEEKAVVYFAVFPKNPTSRDEMLIANELREIRANILAGNTTFTEEAQAVSDDLGSARNGGELGWFGRGRMVREFEAAAFSTPQGEISEPFKSDFGFHILAVDSIRKEGNEIVEVKARHILKNITASIETLDSLETLADKLRRAAENGNLLDAGTEFLVVVQETAPFGRGENPSGMGHLPNLGHFVFDKETKIGDVGELFETENAFVVVSLKDRIARGHLPFEHARAQIRQTLSDSLRIQQAKTILTEISAKIGGQSFEEFAAENDMLNAGTAESITRRQFVPGIGRDNEVIAAAFAIPENTISRPVLSDNGVYIVRTTERNLVRMSADAPEISFIRNQLKNEASRNAYQDWFEAQKRQMNITENVRDFYY